MIPLKLKVRNFLCYRGDVPTLNLEGIRVACLCGENGHGKSALLDAMTWALWGEARGTRRRGRTQDDLVHHSENEMLVELEFEARDERYRVLRRHRRRQNRPGASDLQLLVKSEEGFRPITGDSMAHTQRLIEQLIGLDYDTFINSAFLLQGRADEFTNKTPDKRKEVLASVMGLDQYDLLVERARQRQASRQQELREVEVQVDSIAREVAGKEGCQLELDTVRESLRGTQANLQQARERRDVSLRQVEELRHLDSEARSKKERLPVLERDAVNTRAQAQQHQRHIEEYEALLADRDAVEKGYADLGTAKKCLEESIAAQAKHSELSQDIERVKGRIAAEAVRLSEQARQSEERIAKDLTPRAESVSRVQEEISSLNTQMEKLDLEEGALALERERLQDNVASIAQMKAETARLEEEGKRLRAQVTVLEQSPETAVCPLCKSPLGRDGVQHLRDTHNREIEEKRAAFKRMQADLRSLEEEHASQSRQLGQNEARLRRAQQAVQSRLDSLKRQQEEAQKASSELVSIRSALSQLTMRIEKGDFAAEERKRLALLESDLAALAYNPVRHEEIQQTVKRLSPFEKQHWRLSEAIERLPQERKARDLAHDMLERRQKEIASIQTGLAEVATALVQLPSREKELAVAESEVQRLEQEERDLIGKEGGFADRLKRIQQQEQKLHSLRRKQKSLAEEVEAFGELAEAFGRRGIQAMLIESVIPELEQQANDLLGRMTDNRMHLKLETQREARSGKGDLIETLDIHISDELGTRAYEMYSGGEAFRINLALRIALSRVLAQRKGAPLPVLFIDEGLGTQDSAGRERIIEVIQAIEPLFEKILVITHIEEVKESFPVRIEVQKREGSSTFVVT